MRKATCKAMAILFIGLILPTCAGELQGQDEAISKEVNARIDRIVSALSQGNPDALSELAPMLDDSRVFVWTLGSGTLTTKVQNAALYILQQNTSLVGLPAGPDLTGDRLRAFLEAPPHPLSFSHELRQVIDVPLEQRGCEYRLFPATATDIQDLTLEACQGSLAVGLSKKNYYKTVEAIENMGRIRTTASRQFLLECAAGKHWDQGKNDRETQVWSAIAYALGSFDDQEAARAIVAILRQHQVYSFADGLMSLARITNVGCFEQREKLDQIVDCYASLLDLYPDIRALKRQGYRLSSPSALAASPDTPDWWGGILLEAEDRYWIKLNAIYDLAASRDAVALRYLASQEYQGIHVMHEYSARKLVDIVGLMEKLTGVRVEVRDGRGQWTTQYQDSQARLNYLIYWQTHWRDYRWDENAKCFANRKEALNPPDPFDLHFRELCSLDDQVAMRAFRWLTEADPHEIAERIGKYNLRDILEPRSNALPTFFDRFLPQQALFTDYCRRNGIAYVPSAELETRLRELLGKIPPSKRRRLENDLISRMRYEDLAPIEYWGTLYGDTSNFTFSVGRILDIYYSDHWSEICSTPERLRFYLKKSIWFQRLGIIGLCQNYLNKFNHSRPEVYASLLKMLESETEEEVREAIRTILKWHAPETAAGESIKSKIALDEFLAHPATFAPEQIPIVDLKPEPAFYRQIVDRILVGGDAETLTRLMALLEQNGSLEMVPELMRLLNVHTVLDRGWISRHDMAMNDHGIEYELRICDHAVALLEQLYQHAFPLPALPEVKGGIVSASYRPDAALARRGDTAEAWKELYSKDPTGFRDWGQAFYRQELEAIQRRDSLELEEIGALLESPWFLPEHKAMLLGLLPRVKPLPSLQTLASAGKILSPDDLKYFENLAVKADDYDSVFNLFPKTDPTVLLRFIRKTVKHYSEKDRGLIYYHLIYNTEFYRWMKQGFIGNSWREEILDALERRKRQKDLPEYDSERMEVLCFRVRTLGMPMARKIACLLENRSAFVKELTADLLSEITWQDLGAYLDHFSELPLEGYSCESFFIRDLGIPLDEVTPEVIARLAKEYASMSEKEVYAHYLALAGVDYQNTDGSLDFARIDHILKHDVTEAFVGGGSWINTFQVCAVIRMLELHFGENLGYPELFDNFGNGIKTRWTTVDCRVADWRKHLRDKGVIKLDPYETPSFNEKK